MYVTASVCTGWTANRSAGSRAAKRETDGPPILDARKKSMTAFAAWSPTLTRWKPNSPSPEVQFSV